MSASLPGSVGAWLVSQRARAWFSVFVVLEGIFALAMIWAFWRASEAHGGKPVGSDFMTFWSAARLAVTAGGRAAYDDSARIALQHAVSWMGDDPGAHYAYWYPPPFLLLTAPLGLLPYRAAFFVFLASGYGLLAICLRRIADRPVAWWPLILSPALLLNAIIGQNGAWTACCFACAALFLSRRPAFGGACLGFLVCKPHLAVAVPLALAAARRWRALLACACTASALSVLSWLILGSGAWIAFIHHAGEARLILERDAEDWPKIQSVFSAIRLLSGPLSAAYAAQIVTAGMALTAMVQVSARRPGAALESAGLTASALLVTPYMFDYDLVCLLVPMAVLAALALGTEWRRWEQANLVVLYALPLLARAAAIRGGMPLVPPCLGVLLLLLWRRARFSLA